jgi:hypothetical protein
MLQFTLSPYEITQQEEMPKITGGPYEIRERNKILNTDKPKALEPLFPVKVSNVSRATRYFAKRCLYFVF